MSEDLTFDFGDLNIEGMPDSQLKEEEQKITGATPDGVIKDTAEALQDDAFVDIKETITETEEEEEEEEIKTTSQEAPSSEADSSQQSTLYALAQYLRDEGVLLLDEELENIETIDELKSVIEQSHKQARYANLSETQQRYLDALENGVPVKEYEQIEKDLNVFTSLDQSTIAQDQQLQYELIAIDFMNQGIAEDRAKKLAQLSVTQEGDASVQEAKTALDNIINFKKDQYKQLIDDQKEQTTLELDSIKKAIDDKKEILTMPVNDITKGKLFDFMTTKVASDDNGLPLNKLQKFQRDNPIEANILMNYLFMVTNEGKDLGLIKTNTTSSSSKELEKRLRQLNFDKSGSLIIPDEMISNKGGNKKTKNLNINI